MKAKAFIPTTYQVATFRRPDHPGTFLWSCDCGQSGLTNRHGDPYTNRQGAESGGRVHAAAAHGQALPTTAVTATAEPAPGRSADLLPRQAGRRSRGGTKP